MTEYTAGIFDTEVAMLFMDGHEEGRQSCRWFWRKERDSIVTEPAQPINHAVEQGGVVYGLAIYWPSGLRTTLGLTRSMDVDKKTVVDLIDVNLKVPVEFSPETAVALLDAIKEDTYGN